MKQKFQDLTIEFPLELQYIRDIGLESGYNDHPSFWFEAVIPEDTASEYIGNITEDTDVTVTYINQKKNEPRMLFAGYAAETRVRCEDGFHVLYVKSLAHTAKMDIAKKSRSFFKKGITYHEIIQAVGKDYPKGTVKENIPSKRVTDFPILQYKETDWEFLKRIAAMFEAVLTPDCTKDHPYVTLGVPEKTGNAKKVTIEEQTTIRDLKGCFEDFYEAMTAFSVLQIIKDEKEAKKKEKEKKKAENALNSGETELGTIDEINEKNKVGESEGELVVSTASFLEQEEAQERKKLAKKTKNSIKEMIASGELDISSLGYTDEKMEELIFNAIDSLNPGSEDAQNSQVNVDTADGKEACQSNMEELNHTMLAVRSTRYIPLGSRMETEGSELAVTHVEAYVEGGQIFYEYILRWPDAITARYQDNPALAGISLIGTVKERKGNTVSLNLEIDEDDGYRDGKEDYFFTYAIESKDYYCMPVEGAKVHLYFQTGKEWEAIAVHSIRGMEAGGEREQKIENPDNRSLSNPTGCSIDLTPDGISMTPDDGNTVELKLGKNGDISMRAKNFTLTGKDMMIGKSVGEDGEETICKKLEITAKEYLFLNRCQPNADGAIVPIEDHLIGLAGISQLYTPGKIWHFTTGEPKAPSISYDESELRAQEAAAAAENNTQITGALVARKNEAKSKFGKGLLMAVTGAVLIVATGGAGIAVLGAALLCPFAAAEMQEGMSLKNLAESGDWETEPDNLLKDVLGEPLYTLAKNGLCIAASVMLGGPAVLAGAGLSTGVSFLFDIADGKIDTSWQDYLEMFSTGCMVAAVTGPIGKLGDCGSNASRFAANFAQQFSSSVLSDLANGTLSFESLGENAVRELFGTTLGCIVPSDKKLTSAALNSVGDTAIEAGYQMYKYGEIDPKSLAQTAVTSFANNLLFSSDPVCCSKGHFFVYREDYRCEDLQGAWTFSRRYSSILDFEGAMGKGWLHEYETFLAAEKASNPQDDSSYRISVLMPDTHMETFAYHSGEWVNTRGGTREVTLTEDRDRQTYTVTVWHGGEYACYEYDRKGRLLSVSKNPYSSRRTAITYLGDSRQIDTITTPGGRVLRFCHEKGKITGIKDETGRSLRYGYRDGCLIRAHYTTGGVQGYVYDTHGRITTMDGWDGRDFLTNTYDSSGRVICQQYPDGNACTMEYDDRHKETWFTFSDTGRWEHYYCDDADHVLRTERGMGEALKKKVQGIQAQEGHRSEEAWERIAALEGITAEMYVFDGKGNKTAETDKNGNTRTWEYNEYGLVTREETPDGLITEYAYDRENRITRIKDNENRRTEYAYDDACGKKAGETAWLDENRTATTAFAYDRFGRVVSATDAEGNTEHYGYDEEGKCHNPLFYTAADGTEFSYTLDSMGRTAGITSPYGTVKLTHSDTGEIVRTEDALGNVTEKMVDAIGNVLKLVTPNAYKGSMAGEEAFRYRYDYLDRLTETRDPYGTIHRTIVDMDGNIIKEIHPESYDRDSDSGEGTEYTYDADGYRLTEKHPDGGVTRYKHDGNGNIIKMIRPEQYNEETDDGEGISYTYDAGNRLKEVIDTSGTAIRSFSYDKAGRLTEERDAGGNATLYYYNHAGWLMEKREPVGEKDGELLYNVTKFEYDRTGNKTLEKRSGEAVRKDRYPLEWLDLSFAYDKRNRLTKVSDSLGAAMEYTYDCLNNRTGEKARINEDTYQYTLFEYDAAGRLAKAIRSADREDLGMEPNRYVKKEFLTTTYAYDKNGNVTGIVTPEGYEIHREYDLLDRLTKETHVDRQSGIERSTEYTYDKAGNLLTETDGRGSIQRTYNLLNQMIKETDREGNTTRYHYDKNGNLTKAIQPDNYNEATDEGEGYSFTYDSFGRLESVKNALGYLEEQNEYDADGNLIRKKDALGTLAEYTYDMAGRQKTVTTGGALAKAGAGGKPQPSQSYTYDARGNITGITDGEGNKTRYELDAWGRITTIHKPDGSRETYTYDHAGNITSTTDGNGNTIRYHFNSMNRLKEIVDQKGEEETFTYDSQGRMTGHIDRNRVKTTYGYNMDNQLRFKRAEQLEATGIQAIQSRKTAPATLENKYSYNNLGQLTEASGGGVVYSYTYTPNGNVMDKLVNGSKALGYTYTASGRVAGIQDKTGKKVTYQYNRAGKVESVKDNGKPVAEYSYYADGSLQKVRFANGIETEYTYDADKNYKSIITQTAEGEILLDYTYQYDGNGNRTQKTGAEYVTKYNGNDSSIGTTSYLYDSLQRLQEVSYPTGRVEQYQYDQAGNRALKKYGTAENFKTGSYLEEHYTYDNRNRLLEKNNPQNVTYYQYDNQGNTVSELTKRYLKPETTKVQNGGTTTITNRMAQTEAEQYKTYEYDSFNKTAKVTVEDYQPQSTEGHSITIGKEANASKMVHVQSNFYDAENLRYGIEEDGERTNFVTNGWSVFTELDAEWNPTKRLVRGYGIVASEECGHEVEESIITASIVLDQYHFYHQNEHGDTEYVTGSNGKVTNAYTYDAFGNITNAEELVKNRYTYNGEQYDQISQQYYLRARNYNPLIGRFTQEDVYRGDGLNLYAYCGNNPVMYVDPSGYEFLEDLAYDTQDDINKRINQTPSENAAYGDWKGQRGDSDFVFENKDQSDFHNRVQSTLKEHGTSTVPYKQGQVDFDEFAVFTVEVEVSSSRKVTHPRTNEEIAKKIVEYGGDYNKMYADNVMGIASGSQHSQNVAKGIIESVGIYAKTDMSDTDKIEIIHSLLDDAQKDKHQTIHEENLVKGKTKNKTQWVDTDINKQFGHLGGTSEAKRQEKEKNKKC